MKIASLQHKFICEIIGEYGQYRRFCPKKILQTTNYIFYYQENLNNLIILCHFFRYKIICDNVHLHFDQVTVLQNILTLPCILFLAF